MVLYLRIVRKLLDKNDKKIALINKQKFSQYEI